MIVVWALWSLVVWTAAFGWMLLAAIVSLPFLPFVRFERIQPHLPARMLAMIPRWTLSKFEIVYHPGFSLDRVSVYCFNHTSMLDAHVVLATVPRALCGMMNAAHLWVPVYGWLMKWGNVIPVRRTGQRRFEELNAHVLDRARRGISIAAFPEAHRTLDGKLREFKRGVFHMARNAELPVVPVAVCGLYRVLPKGTWIMRPGRITVHVGPQIETRGLTDAQVDDLSRRCREWIAAHVERGETPADDLLLPGPARAAEGPG